MDNFIKYLQVSKKHSSIAGWTNPGLPSLLAPLLHNLGHGKSVQLFLQRHRWRVRAATLPPRRNDVRTAEHGVGPADLRLPQRRVQTRLQDDIGPK